MCCRTCTSPRHALLDFHHAFPQRTRNEAIACLHTYLPLLSVHGSIGVAKQALKDHGLPTHDCITWRVDYLDPFRISPVDLMHNLILGPGGLFPWEFIKCWELVENNETFCDMYAHLPSPPSLPPLPDLSYYTNFKAKEWLSLAYFAAQILHGFIPMDIWECLFALLRLMSISLAMTIPRDYLDLLHTLCVQHADMFLQLYPDVSATFNMHQPKHYGASIRALGSPGIIDRLH